jgi:hypothetical protein
MSIVKDNDKSKKGLYLMRFSQLAQLGTLIFHAGDLATLWQIRNVYNLHMTLKRYVDNGLLIRIYRGLYALKPVDQLDPLLVGIKALHRFSYISTETVLSERGIVLQQIDRITMVSSLSKKFSVTPYNFQSRKLADRFLYNECGITTEGGVKKATTERAVADLLYFNPKAHFDGERMINWKKVRGIQAALGYPPTPERYNNSTYTNG